MKIKGAMTVLRKEMDFLGHETLEEALVWIEKHPLASSFKQIEAYKVYAKYHQRENTNKDHKFASLIDYS